MNELIKVTEKEGQQLVSARDMHEFLGINERYNDWFNRMKDYGFEENVDFTSFTEKTVKGGRPKTNHILKIEMAKELSMLARNEKGKQARKYFIELEKTFKKLPVMSKLEMIVEIAQSQVETNKRIDRLENTMTIDSAKSRAIQRKVANRVFARIEGYKSENELPGSWDVVEKDKYDRLKRKLFANIYRDLKNKFAVASYRDIRVVDYDKTIQFIQNWIEDSELFVGIKTFKCLLTDCQHFVGSIEKGYCEVIGKDIERYIGCDCFYTEEDGVRY